MNKDHGVDDRDRPQPHFGAPRARLEDVAQLANTSKPIASRVLNDDPTLSVGAELRARIKAAADELGYRPHAAARKLRSSSTGALGMLVPTLLNPVFAMMVRGAFDRARQAGYVVLVAEDFDGQRSKDLVEDMVSSGRVDGLIVASARLGNSLLDVLEQRRVPHVFVNRAIPGSDLNVLIDDPAGIRMATEHLLSLGHRDLGHMSGPSDIDPSRRRVEAFLAAAAAGGASSAIFKHADFLEDDGVMATEMLLRERPTITGLLVSSPSQGAGALFAARRLGLSVPHDLSVISYTDAPIARVLDPPLTVVDMPVEELGAAGVTALLDVLDGRYEGDRLLPTVPRLILRSSTAVVPTRT
jgi:DNA-binding LacI/PurR family transcriptional regulator